jgi:hypothetical protein
MIEVPTLALPIKAFGVKTARSVPLGQDLDNVTARPVGQRSRQEVLGEFKLGNYTFITVSKLTLVTDPDEHCYAYPRGELNHGTSSKKTIPKLHSIWHVKFASEQQTQPPAICASFEPKREPRASILTCHKSAARRLEFAHVPIRQDRLPLARLSE